MGGGSGGAAGRGGRPRGARCRPGLPAYLDGIAGAPHHGLHSSSHTHALRRDRNAAGLRAQVGGKLAKKEGMIKTNLKKVEGLLYDLSIVRAGGVKASVQATQEAAAETAS